MVYNAVNYADILINPYHMIGKTYVLFVNDFQQLN